MTLTEERQVPTPASPLRADDVVISAMKVSIARATTPGPAATDSDLRWPGRIRLITRSHLHRWALGQLADSVSLLVTELVTNALRHGTAASVEVRMTRTSRTVRIEVANGTPGHPAARRVSLFEECGRGLFLVEKFADEWGATDSGAVIWCELRLTEGAQA